jgi:DNA polymerase-3 subunit delta'
VDTLIGHDMEARELRTLATSADPPHALLLAGPEGTGRRRLALEYARLLNCERHPAGAQLAPAGANLFGDDLLPPATAYPCGACRACRLITEGAHPDVVVVGPGDTLCKPRAGESSHEKHPQSRDIRICQVRGMVDLVARFPFEARYRVVIIDPAERLREEAANGLLKTLEEPPGHTIFALVAAAPEVLPETIRSRCRRMDVRTVARATIAAGLRARGVDAALAEQAATASRGRPGRAIAFAARPDLMGDRQRLLDRCARLAAAGAGERLKYTESLVDRMRKDRTTADAELDAWQEYWEAQLNAAARDERIAHPAQVVPLVDALRAVQRAREDLLANVQARPALDLMLLSFPRLTLDESANGSTPAHG